jgi:hypothetical protein
MFSEIQSRTHLPYEIQKSIAKLKEFRQVSNFISCLDPK